MTHVIVTAQSTDLLLDFQVQKARSPMFSSAEPEMTDRLWVSLCLTFLWAAGGFDRLFLNEATIDKRFPAQVSVFVRHFSVGVLDAFSSAAF